MDTPLRFMIIEDSEDDAALIVRALRTLGYHLSYERVDTPESMKEALNRQTWDVILSDYYMPRFSIPEALKLLKERGLDLPFIIVSGTIGEEAAVAMMKLGAHDYLLKDNLSRLNHSIDRELRDAKIRKDHRLAELALRQSEERFRQLAESIEEVFWLTNIEMNEWIYVSPSFEKIWGRTRENLYSNPDSFFADIHPEDRPGILALRKKQATIGCETIYRIIRRDGTTRWIRDRAFPIRNEAGEVYRIAGVAEDITDRKRNEDLIHRLAYYDPLTGLPNRTLLLDRLQQAVLTGRREKKPLTLLLMDLNGFKMINDTLGHHKGDQILKQVGERLLSVVRESDTIARLGGDEFSLLLPGVGDPEYARLVARKILKALEPPFILDEIPLKVGTSIGIAFWPDNAEEINFLIQKADVAMYAAKEARVGYLFYTLRQDKHTVPRLKLMGELDYAIDHHELRLHYQPKFSFKTKQVIGVEALVRWQHPYRGLLYPDQFIPQAEKSGLMNRLTQWVLSETLSQSHAWNQDNIKVSTAVNLSAGSLQNEEIIKSISDLLSKWNVEPDLLNLELTESVMMEEPLHNVEILTALRNMGISISIDDFGTGNASLSYLKKLPVNEIKINNLLVKDIATNKADSIIVHSLIDLGHNLDLHVVAKGVENEKTWMHLDHLGCDSAQGYYMGRPLLASELANRLNQTYAFPAKERESGGA